MLRIRHYILIFCLLYACNIPFVLAQEIDTASLRKLDDKIAEITQDKNFNHSIWGISVLNLRTNETVFEFNSQQSLVPASTMKIITSASALALLGKDYKFKTRLEYDGKIDTSGTLHGNIYIYGGGDPTFGSDRYSTTSLDTIFKKWLSIIREKKIKKIEGSIIGDESIFDYNMASWGWSWGDIGNYYGSGISGLSVYENTYKIHFLPGDSLGSTAKINKVSPRIPGLDLVNFVRTNKSGTGDNVAIYGAPYINTRYMEGTIPKEKQGIIVRGSIPDPAYLCACQFSTYLDTWGVCVSDSPATVRMQKIYRKYKPTLRDSLNMYLSPPLSRIINVLNLWSINIYAEALIKIIGYETLNLGNSYSGGLKIREYWSKRGVDLSGFNLVDGCGLSRLDMITTAQMVKILYLVYKSPYYDVFYNSLPVAGKSGTLKEILLNTIAENNLRAKSGTMTGVKAYAGYVKSRSGIPLAFAIIANNFEANGIKDKMEQIMLKIAEIK